MVFAQTGVVPHVKYSTEDRYAGYAMVEAGLGITMENETHARLYADRVAVLPLDPPQYVEIGITLPEKEVRSPAAAAFEAYALERMKNAEGLLKDFQKAP